MCKMFVLSNVHKYQKYIDCFVNEVDNVTVSILLKATFTFDIWVARTNVLIRTYSQYVIMLKTNRYNYNFT